MAGERDSNYVQGIYIDLEGHSVVLKAAEQSVWLRFSRRGIVLNLLDPAALAWRGDGIPNTGVDANENADEPTESAPEASEPSGESHQDSGSAPTTVVAGRIQGSAVEGRPDRQGKPTAWARFLGHIDGQDGATLLSTTFHGRTREIALTLPENASLTAQGYLHLRADAGRSQRLSSFSVIHLLQYPGKPPRAGASSE